MFWPWKNEEFWRGAAQVLLMLFFLTAAFAFSLPVLMELLERGPEGPVLGLWEPVPTSGDTLTCPLPLNKLLLTTAATFNSNQGGF